MCQFKSRISLTLVLVLILALFTACAGTQAGTSPPPADSASPSDTASSQDAPATPDISSEKVELRISWQSGGARPDLLEIFVKEYEEAHPNVSFVIEAAESGKYQPKIAMDVAADNTPDVFTYWRPEPSYGVDKYLEKGALADLTELFDDPQFQDTYPEFAMNTCTVDGKIVALPAEYAFIMFYANKDILDDCGLDVPVTYDDYLNVIEVVKENGYIPWSVSTKAFASGWERPLGYTFNRYLSNKGENGTLNAFAGSAPFNSPEAIEAANRLYELCAGNAAPDAMTLDDTQAVSKYFNTGQALFFVNGTYAFEGIAPELRDNLVALQWPEMPGAQYNQPIQDKDLVAVWYCASKSWDDPAKKPVLIDFLKTVTDKEHADRLLYDAGSFVPDNDLVLDPARTSQVLVDAKEIADAAEQVKWPLSFAMPENKEPFYSVYTDFWSGKYTGEEFALKLHEIFYEG